MADEIRTRSAISPQPIDETMLVDRSSSSGGQYFCFGHVRVQTVEISGQRCVAETKRATIFLVLQQSRCPVDVSLRTSSHNQVWHLFQRGRLRFFPHAPQLIAGTRAWSSRKLDNRCAPTEALRLRRIGHMRLGPDGTYLLGEREAILRTVAPATPAASEPARMPNLAA